MRSRALLPAILLASYFAVPVLAHASIPFLGPVIPAAQNVCPASWGMLITVINNIISLLITLAIVFVAPLMIAYSGFLFVINPFNAGGIDKAKGILTNTIVGIVISLAGYLIVSALMAVLYHPSGSSWTSQWANIIVGNSNDFCLTQAGTSPGANLNQVVTGVNAVGTQTSGQYSTTPNSSPGNPCNPATLTGIGASQTAANLLACVAQGETGCGVANPPYALNYSWNKDTGNGKASTAAGAYQVLLASNHACYENSFCYAAAGVSGPLNCQKAFDSNGFPLPGNPLVGTCLQAAGNVQCSAAAATCLLGSNPTKNFGIAYATDPYTSSCLTQYGN